MKSKWNQHLPKHLKDLVCIVDGTEIRIPRPSQPTEERSTYSVKKHFITRSVNIYPSTK
jgi:hypothetical protein